MKTSLCIAATLLMASVSHVQAAVFRWSGDCAPNFSWSETCAAGNNWDQGPTAQPGSNDTVILLNGDPITDVDFSRTVKNVIADAPVKFDSGAVLSVNENSSFKSLQCLAGGIESKNESMVAISGTSIIDVLRSDGSRGTFELTGVWSGDPSLEGNVEVVSLGDGTINAQALFSDASTFTNEGRLDLIASIQGLGADLVNLDEIVVLGGGTYSVQPNFRNVGNLTLQDAGTHLTLSGRETYFEGGTTMLPEDTSLILNSFSGAEVHQFLGTSLFMGAGFMEIQDLYEVKANLLFGLGGGTPNDGFGGIRLRDELILEAPATLTNLEGGRMRFQTAVLSGEGRFVNEGQAYTNLSGDGILGVDVENTGTLSVLAPTLVLTDESTFLNSGVVIVEEPFEIRPGSMLVNQSGVETSGEVWLQGTNARLSGSGDFVNASGHLIGATDAANAADVTLTFENVSSDADTAGIVEVFNGSLRFRGSVRNLDAAGVLRGGRWEARDGALVLPRSVTQIGDAAETAPETLTWLVFDTSQSDFESLAVIEATGNATFNDNQRINGDLLVKPGGMLRGSDIRIDGTLTIGEPGANAIAEYAGGTLDSGGKRISRTKTPSPNAKLDTLGLTNHGRILPTDRASIGVLNVDGNYNQSADGRLHIDYDASASDKMDINGDAAIAGILELERIEGAMPTPGQSYTVLTVDDELTGTFSQVVSPDEVSVSYEMNRVTVTILSVTPDLIFSDSFE